MANKQKTVYCPECGRKVLVYDMRGTIALTRKCSKCNKLITYNPDTDRVVTSKVPERQTSSGKRFY